MKKLNIVLWFVLLVGVLAWAAGCSGVLLSPQYSVLLDKTVIAADKTAAAAVAGQLTPADATNALREQAVTWHKFQNARDGKATTQPVGR